MTVGRLNLTVFSSALFCFGTIYATLAQAVPQRPWYRVAFDHVLRVVHSDTQNGAAPLAEPAKQPVQPYVSRITKDAGTITLKGDVPSESDLKILQGVVAATSPGAAFIDKSRVNTNMQDRDHWLAAMTFALRQLGKLERGAAVLSGNSIAIEGVTKSGDDFASMQKKLKDEAPKGVDLHAAVKPHDVQPFVWTANLQRGTLTLSGNVPDRQDGVLFEYARSVFQHSNVNVSSSMEPAKGEPENWLAASEVALDMLSLLSTGSAGISGNVIKLEGVYTSPSVADLLKTYSQRVPAGFMLQTNIMAAMGTASTARAEDVSLAAQTSSASLNP